MDAVDKAGRWIGDKAAQARERERIRVEDRLAKLDELDEAAREFIRQLRQRPGLMWDQEAESRRLRMLGLGPILGDEELEQLIAALVSQNPPSDEAYLALARRLAALRKTTLTEDA